MPNTLVNAAMLCSRSRTTTPIWIAVRNGSVMAAGLELVLLVIIVRLPRYSVAFLGTVFMV
jgi:hypothetical protein